MTFRDLEREEPATIATLLQLLDDRAEEAERRG